jgi:hypothetical protein
MGGRDACRLDRCPPGARFTDRRCRYVQAQPLELAGDLLVTPARILAREAQDELAHLVANRRPPDPVGVRPTASDEPPMPPQQCRGRHQERAPARHPTREGRGPASGRPPTLRAIVRRCFRPLPICGLGCSRWSAGRRLPRMHHCHNSSDRSARFVSGPSRSPARRCPPHAR